MKVVAQNSARVWGGNEKWLATLARGLRERGHQIVLSCHPGSVQQNFDRLGFRTTAVRPRGEADVISAVRFARWLKDERPDAVLLTSWVPTVLGAWAARAARVPRLVVRQGIVREFPRSPIRSFAFRKWIDAVIVNSPEIRQAWLAGANDYPPRRVHVIMNGVEPRRDRRADLRRRLREELGLAPATMLVGGAGHLFPRKGFDVLLRGFASAALTDSRLAILGDGDDAHRLHALAEELRIGGRVDWLGHRANGPEIIAGYDVFVLSSRNEGMANVMLEAMASGVPVIAADVSGARTALAATAERGLAGWITPGDDADALGAALREAASSLRGDRQIVHDRVDEAYWRIENWFSIDRMIGECEAVLSGQSE
jgi:glycosyltransferase involved in cell wall biosynthesis